VRVPGASLAAAGGAPNGAGSHPFADVRANGLRTGSPAAPDATPPAAPAAEAPPPFGGPPPVDGAGRDARPVTAEGLVRRVPGAGLASLRRAGADAGATPPAGPGAGAGAPPEGTALRPPPAQASEADRERMRSMLSRFQSSQRAGRAAADPTAPAPTQEGQ
jgi:hypothetical protein